MECLSKGGAMSVVDTPVVVVSVSTNPVKYVVDCELCNCFVSDETEDGDSLDLIVKEHEATHPRS